MDSITIDVGTGPQKLQGAPLGEVLDSMEPEADAQTVILYGADGEEVTLSLSEVLPDDDLRLFTVIDEETVSFAVARMDGEVLMSPVIRIGVQ
jgi:DMSO/TMAO reductase YedYZ molybdopterin-dependent catalytic subunit